MPRQCVRVDLPGGGTALVSISGNAKACRSCGRLASFACDMGRRDRASGTCDAPICERCRVPVGPGRDYCPPCAELAGVEKQAALPLPAEKDGA